MMSLHWMLFATLLTACDGSDPGGGKDSQPTVSGEDEDRDGFASPEDCNDGDASISPAAQETCNGIDDNCDGTADEGVLGTWYSDEDNDGFGDINAPTTACQQPTGTVSNANDCDDSDGGVFPGNQEVCDGLDNDCNGSTDEDTLTTWYQDSDGDGCGDSASPLDACDLPSGYAASACDCDDSDPDIYEGAPEYCNSADDDCDGEIDDDPIDAPTWYLDYDEDGYGSITWTEATCTAPEKGTTTGGDCNDASVSIYPGAQEGCNELDDDCDGTVDNDAVSSTIWYADTDGDSYGDSGATSTACDMPSGYVTNATDCDDTDSDEHPGANELCDGDDDDCDGTIDEEGSDGALLWYGDGDGDGYGNSTDVALSCAQPTGYVSSATDCDDANATVYPGADEYCDGDDNNCDGIIDEDGAVDASLWYADADRDTYAGSDTTLTACDQPSGYYATPEDCDDSRADVSPSATELCNGWDDDCDGDTDEDDAFGAQTWYADTDSDSYGDPDAPTTSCYQPTGYVSINNDCDDADTEVHPGATEICLDGINNDCDGTTDRCSLTTVGTTLLGTTAADYAGISVAGGEDLTGDGHVDLIVGATGVAGSSGEEAAGRVYVWDATVTGTNNLSASTTWIAGSEDASVGVDSGDSATWSVAHFGHSVALGNVNGDGNVDLLVGEVWPGGYADPGAIYLFYGPISGTQSADSADVVISGRGGSTGKWLGRSLSSGDLDDDGIDDIVAAQQARYNGAMVFFGGGLSASLTDANADFRLTGDSAYDGATATCIADLTGDGVVDLVVGDEGYGGASGGALMIVAGPLSAGSIAMVDADTLLTGSSGILLGHSVGCGGDVEGDGFNDLLVAAPAASSNGVYSGTTYLINGTSSWPGADTITNYHDGNFSGAGSGDYLGYSLDGAGVSIPGDLDGDGLAEVVMVSPNADPSFLPDAGVTYVFRGDRFGSYFSWTVNDADSQYGGLANHANEPNDITGVGDADGDGYDDMLLGAAFDLQNGDSAGAAFLVSGRGL